MDCVTDDGPFKGMMAMKTYGPIARTFHWGFIGIFLYGIIKQVDDISLLEDSALLRLEVLFAWCFWQCLPGGLSI